MQIISWNVASIRARLPLLIDLLNEKKPDIVLLQEIKTTTETFPFAALEQVGYTAYVHGQKGFNGVAVLSKTPLNIMTTHLPGMEADEQARFIQVQDNQYTYISVYVPNGTAPAHNPFDTSRLEYKLHWLTAFRQHIQTLSDAGHTLILGGDFNIIAENRDVYNPALFQEGALMNAAVQNHFRGIEQTPLINTVRHFYPNETLYSFWDFQMGAARRNLGILLDYIFVSPILKEHLNTSGIYKEYRYREKPSDHAPVFCSFT